ncbi:MAG: F0F1 ATP synthase subunit B [Defluviitaleaceae bacterium]|nr:F0F1 ATP synthase subunit B [Defluviitaleaceae bacterium]
MKSLNFAVLLHSTVLPQGRVLGFDMEFLRELGFLWINVIIMIILLAYILYKPVKNFMQKRAERIKSQLDSAETARSEALAKKEQYELQLRAIEAERDSTLDAARKKAVQRGEEIIADARSEAALVRERAQGDVSLEIERARDEMKTQLVELSVLLAGRLVKSSLTGNEQERLVNEALADLGAVKWAE